MEILRWPREDQYRWLVCGDRVISRPETERHVLNHHVAAAAERVVRRRYRPRSVDQAKESEGEDEECRGDWSAAMSRPCHPCAFSVAGVPHVSHRYYPFRRVNG